MYFVFIEPFEPKIKGLEAEIAHRDNIIPPAILLKKTRVSIERIKNEMLITLAFLNSLGNNESHDFSIS